MGAQEHWVPAMIWIICLWLTTLQHYFPGRSAQVWRTRWQNSKQEFAGLCKHWNNSRNMEWTGSRLLWLRIGKMRTVYCLITCKTSLKDWQQQKSNVNINKDLSEKISFKDAFPHYWYSELICFAVYHWILRTPSTILYLQHTYL